MAVQAPRTYADVKAVVGGYLRDLAFAQSSPQKMFGYKRAAITHPAVRVLAHPRGRITGSRAGVIADWDAVFAAAARRGVAIEIDGDPDWQDVDHTLATRALEAQCLFALDNDAHTTTQLSYADTAQAHARLAGIPADRIVNCWPLDWLLAWLADPASAHRR